MKIPGFVVMIAFGWMESHREYESCSFLFCLQDCRACQRASLGGQRQMRFGGYENTWFIGVQGKWLRKHLRKTKIFLVIMTKFSGNILNQESNFFPGWLFYKLFVQISKFASQKMLLKHPFSMFLYIFTYSSIKRTLSQLGHLCYQVLGMERTTMILSLITSQISNQQLWLCKSAP